MKKTKKLNLNRVTIRPLSAPELASAVGATDDTSCTVTLGCTFSESCGPTLPPTRTTWQGTVH